MELDLRTRFFFSYAGLDGMTQAMLRRLSLLDMLDFAAGAGAVRTSPSGPGAAVSSSCASTRRSQMSSSSGRAQPSAMWL